MRSWRSVVSPVRCTPGRGTSRPRRLTGHGGYSDVTVLPDGTILVLYEAARAGGLYLARFNLPWLE